MAAKKSAAKASPEKVTPEAKAKTYRINPSQPFTTGYIHKRKFYAGDSEVELDEATAAELTDRGIIGEAQPVTEASDETPPSDEDEKSGEESQEDSGDNNQTDNSGTGSLI